MIPKKIYQEAELLHDIDGFHSEYTLDKIVSNIDVGLRTKMFQGEYSHRNLEIEIGGSDGRY